MGIGAILVGVALALVVGAFLARPLRVVNGEAGLERKIERWVAEVQRSGTTPRRPVEAEPGPVEEAELEIRYCPQCGRRVGPDDRFCAGCGTPLRGGAR